MLTYNIYLLHIFLLLVTRIRSNECSLKGHPTHYSPQCNHTGNTKINKFMVLTGLYTCINICCNNTKERWFVWYRSAVNDRISISLWCEPTVFPWTAWQEHRYPIPYIVPVFGTSVSSRRCSLRPRAPVPFSLHLALLLLVLRPAFVQDFLNMSVSLKSK